MFRRLLVTITCNILSLRCVRLRDLFQFTCWMHKTTFGRLPYVIYAPVMVNKITLTLRQPNVVLGIQHMIWIKPSNRTHMRLKMLNEGDGCQQTLKHDNNTQGWEARRINNNETTQKFLHKRYKHHRQDSK